MSESLFDSLGGADKIALIVDTMYEGVMADEQLAPFFKNTDMQRLRKMQFEFISAALGGPVGYSGAELQGIHAGRGITQSHFSRFVGHLVSSMETHGASKKQVDDMLGLIAMYRDRIIGGANVDG